MGVARQTNREKVLIDQRTLTGPHTGDWVGINGGWGLNPRFVAIAEESGGLVTTPLVPIRIQHTDDRVNIFDLYNGFAIVGDGSYAAYTEDLATRFPFNLIRAIIGDFVDYGTLKLSVIAIFDRSR